MLDTFMSAFRSFHCRLCCGRPEAGIRPFSGAVASALAHNQHTKIMQADVEVALPTRHGDASEAVKEDGSTPDPVLC